LSSGDEIDITENDPPVARIRSAKPPKPVRQRAVGAAGF
jgi:antitoxin (DNA-binding transcriptional repressor) of toxin-antitoxin stability system